MNDMGNIGELFLLFCCDVDHFKEAIMGHQILENQLGSSVDSTTAQQLG